MAKKDGGSSIDADAIRQLADLLTETNLTEIEIENGGGRIRVSRGGGGGHFVAAAPATAAPTTSTEPAKPTGPHPGAVTSPMVGTVYVAPQPGSPPFIKVGDSVKEGDTLLIVEAMKTMNPIAAPRAGTVTEICVKDMQPVEFGQQLVIIG
ncbi:MAG TPA: acetyl-CoA carboxylase biotin carboxyl carrier protein [Rhizomicrobium sp.]|jgi:acetyl-CoA carboxylase biotin carboxyl carrier protein